MTRLHRAIQLPFAAIAFALIFAAAPAQASGVVDFFKAVGSHSDSTKPLVPDNADADSSDDDDADTVDNATPAPVVAKIQDTGAPTVETSQRRLYCVEYARLRSGLQIFGDAKYWWDRAADLYSRVAAPVADAVMVFSGSKRISHGHVAVVTAILSPREIKVDHANWQNHGEIDLNMPVLDVSKDNDWSQVRVWDPKSGQFGARTYAISGFIARDLPKTNGS